MSQSPRAGSRVALALSTLITLGLTACGTQHAPETDQRGRGGSKSRYNEVIEDSSPKPQDVIDVAGAPEAAERSDDGSLVLSFHPTNVEDDEGPAAYAWRLYSPAGKRITDHAESSDAEMGVPGTFHSCTGGFVFAPAHSGKAKYFFLDTSGKKHSVGKQDAPRDTRPGDVLIGDTGFGMVDMEYAYRPSTRTVAPIPMSKGEVISVAVDTQRGTAWGYDQGKDSAPHRIVSSTGGGQWSHTLPGKYAAFDLAAGGGTFVAYTDSRYGSPKAPVLHISKDGVHWRTVGSSPGMPMKDFRQQAEVDVLADGRILVTDPEEKRSWLGGSAGSGFTQVKSPVGFVRTSAQGDVLLGTADSAVGSYKRVEGEGLWMSVNGGRDWTRFRDGKL